MLDETLDEFLNLCAHLGDVPGAVLATLTGTAGRGQVLGRRAWLLPGGERLGTLTLGGCADSALHRAAQDVRTTGQAQHVHVELGSGEAYEFGLTCSGQVNVQLHRASPAAPLWTQARQARAAGQALTLVTVCGARPGVTLLTPAQAVSLGTPPTSAQSAHAGALAGRGGPLHRERTRDALYEHWPSPPQLVIVGSGPVARPLARQARTLGLHVTVTDDRPDRLHPQDWPDAHRVLGVQTGQELQLPALGPHDALVVLSHDYAHELSVLTRALTTPAAYIALVASHRRGRALLNFMRDTGTPADLLRRIRTPAGLDLGLNSPAGIALSVLSELAQTFGHGAGTPLSLPGGPPVATETDC